jgi:hypothetical protein
MKKWHRFGRAAETVQFHGNRTQMNYGQLERLQNIVPIWEQEKTITCHDESRV